jgi:hypothetical protein
MSMISKSFFGLFLTLSLFSVGFAQAVTDQRMPARNSALAAGARQLRFSSLRPVETLRLQIHDQAGATIYDSGTVAKSEILWPAQKEGIYDWTLTIKEPGAASVSVKRGKVDLSDASGAATIPVVVGGSGTPGTIAKWSTATDLTDSEAIKEDGGNVSIGSTPGSNIRLRVYYMPEDRNSANAIQAVLQPSKDPDDITTGSAVYALSQGKRGSNFGVHAGSFSNIGIGVFGQGLHETTDPNEKSEGIGVKGNSLSRNGIGVEGVGVSTTGDNIGVRGESMSNTGVGVLGEIATETGLTFGVKGINSGFTGRGILGHATHPSGVNFGVVGRTDSPNGFAGYFIGRVHVAGFLSKAGGAFKIDHPLDPENKYLSHSFVESPDMMNIYNGIVTLGKDGTAEVTLPDWFEALNREFRYQLTSIGDYAPVFIAKKVQGNRFKIAGGKPGMEISWQLTGVRKDAYAEKYRIQVEEMKPQEARGKYLHPDAFEK